MPLIFPFNFYWYSVLEMHRSDLAYLGFSFVFNQIIGLKDYNFLRSLLLILIENALVLALYKTSATLLSGKRLNF